MFSPASPWEDIVLLDFDLRPRCSPAKNQNNVVRDRQPQLCYAAFVPHQKVKKKHDQGHVKTLLNPSFTNSVSFIKSI